MKNNVLNCILIILNIIAILIIIYIVSEILPFIPCDYSIEKISKINNLTLSVSIGIVLSSFFYLLLVFLPELNRRRTVRATISAKLDTIINNIQTHIAYFNKKYSMNGNMIDNFINIPQTNFQDIKTIEDCPTNFYAETESDGIDINIYTELDYFYANSLFIKRVIESILSTPSIVYEDVDLIKTLSEIKENSFYNTVEILHKNKGKGMTVGGVNSSIYRYYTLYGNLLKHIKPKTIISIKEKQDNPNVIKIPVRVV